LAKRYLVNFNSQELRRRKTEYLIIGGGISGLYTAWAAAQTGASVVLLTKGTLTECNSQFAQGGIAAVTGEDDSVEMHVQDTLTAGAGLCWEEAVNVLVTEGPARIRDLIKIGVDFDSTGAGLSVTREGGHSLARILHARDATGAEIVRALVEEVTRLPEIEVLENQHVVDLLVKDNVCYGALVLDGSTQERWVAESQIVVLATGGIGQLYRYTTNPESATGDGIAIAFRAGVEVMDMEFVQFHPTSLVIPGAPRFLISEAVRGEGAILRNATGHRFMPDYHAMAELAPRDIVARAILSEMETTGADHVYLDMTQKDPEKIKARFPTIAATCARYGLDVTTELLPVAPAAHFMMGGIKTDLWGQTDVERLFCCGETSCLGVHGANRLASNSLLDCLVFGNRIVQRAAVYLCNKLTGSCFINDDLVTDPTVDFKQLRAELQQMMNEKVGPLRTGQGLDAALSFCDKWLTYLSSYEIQELQQIEVVNMLEVGRLIAQTALMRSESRGGHFRLDFPQPEERWRRHILLKH